MRSLVVVLALCLPAAAGAAKRSYWNESRTAIYTLHEDGRRTLGGSVDGVGMVQFHGVVGPGPMIDFVRSRTDAGGGLHWTQSCIFITPDAAGSSDIAGNEEQAILERVLGNWEAETEGCGEISFRLDVPQAREAGYDGYNVIKYREDRWCRPAHGDDPEECYSEAAAAITTLFFIDRPGEADDGVILDADIEFNSVNFALAVCDGSSCESDGEGTLADLENTMAHEIGHLLGLDHTCWEGNPAEAPEDGDGNPAPQCFPESLLSTAIKEATMYNFQTPGEIKKRSLEEDDIAGFCAIYPPGAELGACERVDIDGDDGWCAIAPTAPRRGIGWAAPLGLLALVGIAVASGMRRSHRKRDPA